MALVFDPDPRLQYLSAPCAFYSLLRSLRRKEWVVYSKPPFRGPEHVLKYLARYTHRVAISNGRLLNLEDGQVRFRWRDSRHNRSSVMRLDAAEFIRRFLLHVLPAAFMKIRHFGLLANRNRRQTLALCRIHLSATVADLTTILSYEQNSALNRSSPSADAAPCTSSRTIFLASASVRQLCLTPSPSIPH